MNLSGSTKQEKEMCKLIHDTNTSLSKFKRCTELFDEWLKENANKIDNKEISTTKLFVLSEHLKSTRKEVINSIDSYYLEFKKDFVE